MVLLVFTLLLALYYVVEPFVLVEVNEGKLLGIERNVSTGLGTFYSFKGIPYAEPPVGQLRFKAPVPNKGWTGVRNAIQHGPQCIHYDIFTLRTVNGSEDCLFLNVYTPKLEPQKPFPVVIYFHGGGWKSGSANEDVYGPDFLVIHDVILVTVNYRLDAIGFLNLNTKSVPGNAGIKDQVLALKWVHDNIKHFGGNNNEITIMGQSAGGSSVIYHMMSPMSKGLFKRAITMSGVPFNDWALPFESEKRAFQLGKTLGKNTQNSEELLEFLQNVPALDLINQNTSVLSQENIWINPLKMYPFVPVVENDFGQERFLVQPFKEALIEGNLEDVDLLIGYTSKENLVAVPQIEAFYLDTYNKFTELLLPREIMYEIPPKDAVPLADKIHQHYFGNRHLSSDTMPEIVRLNDDNVYIYNINRFLKHLPDRHSKTYMYKFFSVSDRNLFSLPGELYGIGGCAHTDDYRYLFSDLRTVEVDSKEYRMINETCILFTNFIKYGNPTPDSGLGVKWPEYEKNAKGYMIINETLDTGTSPDAEIFDWWSDIFRSKGIDLP